MKLTKKLIKEAIKETLTEVKSVQDCLAKAEANLNRGSDKMAINHLIMAIGKLEDQVNSLSRQINSSQETTEYPR